MGWTTPKYSRSRVNWAGQLLSGRLWAAKKPPEDPTEIAGLLNEAFDILGNWRTSHSFPLNTVHVSLKSKARRIDKEALTVQRLKRSPSILRKLLRERGMELSRMQDIGGCRAIVGTVSQVRRLRDSLLSSKWHHRLGREFDYIATPSEAGYRSIHLIYRYQSDRKETFNKHLVEIQLRSSLQHAWATAVETVGTFLSQALKASEGDAEWLEFFRYTSSAFALAEGTPVVPGMASDRKALAAEIRTRNDQLSVLSKLRGYGLALKATADSGPGANYFLLQLDPDVRLLRIAGFRREELARATEAYLELEKKLQDKPGAQAVLVAAESLDSLRRSYPNYYLDTQAFEAELRKLIGT